ncbi:MAG TPA: hypothetical protein VKU01_19555 [Bryobacteraceae bacterium]|nr:hypothetical protein [Bryobacteraceae bacterium]
MTREAVAALTTAGVMGFNPVSDQRNFTTVSNPETLRSMSMMRIWCSRGLQALQHSEDERQGALQR